MRRWKDEWMNKWKNNYEWKNVVEWLNDWVNEYLGTLLMKGLKDRLPLRLSSDIWISLK